MPISLADPAAGDDLAAQTIAAGEPSDFATNFQAAWHSSMLNDRFVGHQDALETVYDNFNDKVFKSSGVRLPNPMRGEVPDGTPDLTGDPRIPTPPEFAFPYYEAAAHKLGAKPPTLDDARAQANAMMYGAEQARNARRRSLRWLWGHRRQLSRINGGDNDRSAHPGFHAVRRWRDVDGSARHGPGGAGCRRD